MNVPLILILFLPSVNASTFYVSTNGNDKNNGRISFPWRTVVHAWENSGGGDTVFVRQGTYTEHEMWLHMNTQGNGIENQMWTLSSYPGEKARFTNAKFVIDDNYVRIQGLLLDGDESSGCSWMYVRCTEGIREHVEILNNIFTGKQTIPVLFFIANNSLVQGNTVNITNGSTSHGIYIMHGNKNIIRNNYITGMKKYGIHVYDENKYNHYAAITNYLIENNIVIGSQSKSGIIVSSGADPPGGITIDSVTIRNNLIFNNNGYGIYIRYGGKNKNIEIYNNTIFNNDGGIYINGNIADSIIVHNNIFVSNGSHNINAINVNTLTVSHNLYWKPSLVGRGATDDCGIYKDPLFLNINEGDFRLQADSPAIDAGVDLGFPYIGIAPDIGAFEYNLPESVELCLFEALLKGNTVQLNWQTTSEANNIGFEVERGLNMMSFEKIGFVKDYDASTMSQSYRFLDKNVKEGKYFYRIKQLNMDGSFKYSTIIKIKVNVPD